MLLSCKGMMENTAQDTGSLWRAVCLHYYPQDAASCRAAQDSGHVIESYPHPDDPRIVVMVYVEDPDWWESVVAVHFDRGDQITHLQPIPLHGAAVDILYWDTDKNPPELFVRDMTHRGTRTESRYILEQNRLAPVPATP